MLVFESAPLGSAGAHLGDRILAMGLISTKTTRRIPDAKFNISVHKSIN